MKPSEEFLASPIGEAVADYGESCEEASLAHDNREARLFHTEMADKHLATVERLIAEREKAARIEGMVALGNAIHAVDDSNVDVLAAIDRLIAEERAKEQA